MHYTEYFYFVGLFRVFADQVTFTVCHSLNFLASHCIVTHTVASFCVKQYHRSIYPRIISCEELTFHLAPCKTVINFFSVTFNKLVILSM